MSAARGNVSETTKRMQKYILDEMNESGSTNKINALYMNEICKAVFNSKNNERLKSKITTKDSKANSIAFQLVQKFLQKYQILDLTKEAFNMEIQQSQLKYGSMGNIQELKLQQTSNPMSELLQWNEEHVEEKRQIEEEEQAKKRAKEEALLAEQARSSQGSGRKAAIIQESAFAEREFAVSTRDVPLSPTGESFNRIRFAPEAQSEMPHTSFRFVRRETQSMLPEGARSPKGGPRSPNGKSYAQIFPRSVVNTPLTNNRSAPSVVSAQTERPRITPMKSQRERPKPIQTDALSQ
ncbi:hypothetical protein TVAG_267150 [Trichomonas vaginalis G3]|uniref:Uncharacterized protein n=1 Tax=Trichomonas vaginalis (strain ATCC PRA-98 / G3) TaxID=412133 RepID=A2F553_TRIV3|nr:hypothetical protein TVAGG3_0495760 [Trichomonas vaginalis G3]EAX99946.1 hypothetical protein TVAG_267150 [Trichomonas vaginalis G3]KAI5516705.1 hypothetical protein TVAGG3_0495760 [Trichomonas vaginalis G3]|eukprot:XP_001312876.1 hypothetical protein [Trichomonas vaginalis G3]